MGGNQGTARHCIASVDRDPVDIMIAMQEGDILAGMLACRHGNIVAYPRLVRSLSIM